MREQKKQKASVEVAMQPFSVARWTLWKVGEGQLPHPLVTYDMYTCHYEPSQLARGDLGALRYAPGTVGKLTMSPFHRRIAGFVKLDTREMALVAIRRLPHCQAR